MPPTPAKALHIFISRAGEDAAAAREIAEVLQAVGYAITIQDTDFNPGESFVDQMRLALERADLVIAVLSPDYLAKEFTTRELFSAIADRKKIIPVRVAEVEPPHPIKDLICIDFAGKSESDRKAALLRGIGQARSHPVYPQGIFGYALTPQSHPASQAAKRAPKQFIITLVLCLLVLGFCSWRVYLFAHSSGSGPKVAQQYIDMNTDRDYNLSTIVSMLESAQNITIKFNEACDKTVKTANVEKGDHNGKTVEEFLTNLQQRINGANVKYHVIKEANRPYEIVCP
jgi:hypothetical protein